MFEVGDIVVLRDCEINKGIKKLKLGERYAIKFITYTSDGINDIYLSEYASTPYYHKRFELCPFYNRKQKINKILCLK